MVGANKVAPAAITKQQSLSAQSLQPVVDDGQDEKSPDKANQSKTQPKLRKLELATIDHREMPIRNVIKGDRFSNSQRMPKNLTRNNFNLVAPNLGSIMSPKANRGNRYHERVKAQERLRKLQIMDVSLSPQSILGHGLLTREGPISGGTNALFADIRSPCHSIVANPEA